MGRVVLNKKRDEKQNNKEAKIEATCAIIKPDAANDGRLEMVYNEIKDHCRGQELEIIGSGVMPPEQVNKMLKSHYMAEGKFEKTGIKVLKAFKMRKVPVQARDAMLSRFGLSADSPYEIGKWVMDLELREYAGWGTHFIIIAGPSAISSLYNIRGASDPLEAKEGTIRAKFSHMGITDMFMGNGKALDNIVHMPEDEAEAADYLMELCGKTAKEIINNYNIESGMKALIRVHDHE